MHEKNEKYNPSTRNYIIALIILLTTNVLMGSVILLVSERALNNQISERMLDIAGTAAYQINGDDVRTIVSEDEGTYKWKRALKVMNSFKENIKLENIYVLRKAKDGSFCFILDADNDNPAEFGTSAKTTKALLHAYGGNSDVDKKPHSEQRGRFYSAYSPVFDSEGKVSGVVGVDFDADLYDGIIDSNREVAIVLVIIAMTIGVVLSVILIAKNRQRYSKMMKKMDALYSESLKLDNIITSSSIKKLEYLPKNSGKTLKVLAEGEKSASVSGNEYDRASSALDDVYDKLQKYFNYIDNEIVIDNETGVYNKIAYKKKVALLNDSIKAGNADFSVAFIDINDLKRIYTSMGYETGDAMLYEYGRILEHIFGKENIYHIMGLEYIIVAEKMKRIDMLDSFKELEKRIRNYKFNLELEQKISVAKGYATFDYEKHKTYREVFVEAKTNSDKDRR